MSKISITQTDQEKNVYEYDITYNGKDLSINCSIYVVDSILIMTDVNVEGPGQNSFPNKMRQVAKEIGHEFCKIFKTHEIIIIGAKRTAGKTANKKLQPMHFKY